MKRKLESLVSLEMRINSVALGENAFVYWILSDMKLLTFSTKSHLSQEIKRLIGYQRTAEATVDVSTEFKTRFQLY